MFQNPSKRKGFSLAEMVIVIAMSAILAAVLIPNLFSRQGRNELDGVVRRIATLMREAQSRSVAQASSSAWGVYFENGATPFYALFSGTYVAGQYTNYNQLPSSIRYATSSIPAGTFKQVVFSQIEGRTTPTSVVIYLVNNSSVSATISVATSGAVSY